MTAHCVWTLVFVSASSARSEPPVVLENEYLRVEFSATDGAITRLTNKTKSLELISIESPHATALGAATRASGVRFGFQRVPHLGHGNTCWTSGRSALADGSRDNDQSARPGSRPAPMSWN